jgi:hypothetical protein
MIITKDITRSTNIQNDNLVKYYQRVTGRNTSESGVNLGLRQLANNSLWRSTLSYAISGGTVTVTFNDTVYSTKDAVKIVSTANVPFTSLTETLSNWDTSFTTTVFVEKSHLPAFVKAAATVNSVIWSNNLLVLDGRDHSENSPYNVIPGKGLFGVWSTNTFLQKGSSKIGGTNVAQIDFAPAMSPIDSSIIRHNQAGPFPGTPDSVLGGASSGFPEGTLKSLAQSGINGSQYAVDPVLLTLPLTGVTYVELTSGGTWQPTSVQGSGILVVHNSAKNALIEYLNSGTFVGVIIADDIHYLNTTIVGAVVSMTKNPYLGRSLGAGSGSILFSSSAVINSIFVKTYTDKILAWWE